MVLLWLPRDAAGLLFEREQWQSWVAETYPDGRHAMLKSLWHRLVAQVRKPSFDEGATPQCYHPQKPAWHPQKSEILTRLKVLGITQTEFAAIVGVTPRTVSNWVRGRTRMSEAATLVLALIEGRPDVRRDLCAGVKVPYAPRGKPFERGNPYRFGDRRRRTWVAGAQYARAAA
jgi:putative transcriptional regulator